MLQTLRKKIERSKGKLDQARHDARIAETDVAGLKTEIETIKKAQGIIIAVASATQNELEYRITEPVTLALSSVYNEPDDPQYKMSAAFETADRGTTECKLMFDDEGNLMKPMDASGGGPIDIASFALAIGAWSLKRPQSRPVLVLDEPFKWVSRRKMPLAGQMLRETSKKLGLQIIMISHIPELIECADRIIMTSMKNKKSSIQLMGRNNET